jgi:serine/threonine protein kinase
MTLPEDTILVNRYRIDGLLAHGGMGAIYRAFDTNLSTPVAIKENFFQTPHRVAQFKQEALILARLRHPALPRVIHHFSFEGQQYLVMDFVEGENLWEMIKRQGKPLNEPDALNYMVQVCQAVSYLHQQTPPIIHRDIKPQNIKVTPQGKAVLVDFGIAREFEGQDSRTEAGARGATPGFSPPEQFSAKGTTPASDVYALGATLYALLTGKKPPNSVSLLVGNAQFEAPNVTNPAVSRQTTQAVINAMQTQPERRPQSVAEWQKRLESIARVLPPPDATQTQPRQPAANDDTLSPTPVSRPDPAPFWLVDQRGVGYPVREKPVKIGRHPDAEIVVDDINVSRFHAQVKAENNRCYVLDENSANGTFLNEQSVGAAWRPFNPGDVLIIGPVRFYLTSTQPVKVATPKPKTPPAAQATTTRSMTLPPAPKKSRSKPGVLVVVALVLLLALVGGAGYLWFNPAALDALRGEPVAAVTATVANSATPTALPQVAPPTATASATPTRQPVDQPSSTTVKADVLVTPTPKNVPSKTATATAVLATKTATPTKTPSTTPTATRAATRRAQVVTGPTIIPVQMADSVPELGRGEVIDVEINPKNLLEVYALVKRDGIYKSVRGGDGPWGKIDLDGSGLTSLAIDPANPTRLYAPTWNAVLKSTDGGNTWDAKTSGLVSNQSVDVVTVHPADANLLFAGIGETLVVSTDQGETWTSQGYGGGLGVARLNQIVVDPFVADTVYVVGMAAAIYKSQDGGRSFIPMPYNVGEGAFGLAAHPTQKDVYLAGINSFSAGIIKTENGFDFREVSDGLIYGGADSAYSAISFAPSNPNIVYAGSGFESDPDSKGMFKSIDGGQNWQRINVGLAINPDTGYPYYIKSVAVHPTNPDIVFIATGAGLYQSSDGGQNWQLK